jgi:two-component system sensor histidine kinase KdpD
MTELPRARREDADGDARASASSPPDKPRPRRRLGASVRSYALATISVAVATVVACLVRPHLELADIVMIYLVGIIFVSTRVGYAPSLFAALLSVASLDFFCVPPLLTFAMSDLQHIIAFAVLLLVAAVMTTLTSRMRAHAVAATERERRTATLYAASRELASTRGRSRLAAVAARHIKKVFDAKVAFFLPAEGGRLSPVGSIEDQLPMDDMELAVAEWTYAHKEFAGLGTHTSPEARALYLPLVASRGAVGVLGIARDSRERFLREERELLDAFVNQAAVAIERAVLAADAEQARLHAESERLRNTLFSSVSHDLRTPLTAISGAAAILREDGAMSAATRCELADTIYEQTDRLGRLLTNLLEMARLESGSLKLRREWQPIEDVIGSSLHRLRAKLAGRNVTAAAATDLPLAELDAALMEQVLVNLLENALKYTPAGSPIDVLARREGDHAIVIDIADRGPGIPPGQEERILEKFQRADSSGVPGYGLGLTISRGLVEAHGGRLVARNRPGGGALFRIELPFSATPPTMRGIEPEIAEAE